MLDAKFPDPKRTVYTVSAFNAEIKQLLLDHLEPIWLEGEISNLSRPASGHIYFSLKDNTSQVQCAMFLNRNRALDFEPENGMQVIVHARADLYEVRGNFQLIVNFMESTGHGDLHKQFEQLKKKLAKEGLFDQHHKQAIPSMPQRVGVITSKDGAALHDILTTFNKRCSSIEIIVYPTTVQGNTASASICEMIEIANAQHETDILILARGGGSLEDLWPFNEEQVARAIASSKLPIITGIGHEVDFTISDFVADAYASTPTAAAQRASPDRSTLIKNIVNLRQRLKIHLIGRIETAKKIIELQNAHLSRFHPITRIEQWIQRMDDTSERLCYSIKKFIKLSTQSLELLQITLEYNSPLDRIRSAFSYWENTSYKLRLVTENNLKYQHHHLEQLAIRLQSLSPLLTLDRGYSITTDQQGQIIHSIDQLATRQKIEVHIKNGLIDATVNKLCHKNSKQ